MRFSSTLLLSLLPAAFALPSLAPRQDSGDRAPELLQTVKDLNAAVPELTKAVNAFEGEWLSLLPQALGVVAAETKVDLTIVKATKITEDSTPFTPAETTEIVQTLASGIGPIQDSLTAIKTKVCFSFSLICFSCFGCFSCILPNHMNSK